MSTAGAWSIRQAHVRQIRNPSPQPTTPFNNRPGRTTAIARNDLPLCRPAMPTLPVSRSVPGDRLTLVFYACFSLPRHLASVWWRWKGLIANILPPKAWMLYPSMAASGGPICCVESSASPSDRAIEAFAGHRVLKALQELWHVLSSVTQTLGWGYNRLGSSESVAQHQRGLSPTDCSPPSRALRASAGRFLKPHGGFGG